MVFIYNLNIIISKLFILYLFKCTVLSFHLNKVSQMENFHQIYTFISDTFTDTSELQAVMRYETPNKIYLFDTNENQNQLYNKSLKSEGKNIYGLQESLVTFYTSNLNETKSFLNFLVLQLSVEKRPKCLITYSLNDSKNEDKYENQLDMIDILKYAWDKKFLDFTVIISNSKKNIINNLITKIYYFNPFYNLVFTKKIWKKTAHKYLLINLKMRMSILFLYHIFLKTIMTF